MSLAFLAMGPGTLAATNCAPGADIVRCRVDEINALDREVAQAFSAASVMLDVNGRQKLRRDQDLYDAVRKAGQSGKEFDLSAQISLRRDFLRAIREPRGKMAGPMGQRQRHNRYFCRGRGRLESPRQRRGASSRCLAVRV